MSYPVSNNNQISLIEEIRIIRMTASALRASIENKISGLDNKLKELQDVRARMAG